MTVMALALVLFLQGTTSVRPGTVAGQVRAMDGSVAVAVQVTLFPAPAIGGVIPSDGPNYFAVQAPVGTILTNSEGRYRLNNIPSGRYFIVANGTYYPSTTDLDRATVITVNPDSTTDNLDFRILTPYGGKVSGRVTPAPTRPEKAVLYGLRLADLLEVPVGSDGSFDFGHIPTGDYLICIAPTPAGMPPLSVRVGEGDVQPLQIVRPPTQTVSGRIVVQNGPLPRGILAFHTPQSYVAATINPDGTFTAQLHSARHQVELAGLPSGYSLSSMRIGSQDVSQGLAITNAPISDVVINIAAPTRLSRVRGQIQGLSASRVPSPRIELTGPIIGTLETSPRQDGAFEFAAVTPGFYTLRLPQVPELAPVPFVVGWRDTEVQVVIPGR